MMGQMDEMDGWMDGKLHEKGPRRLLIYVIGGYSINGYWWLFY
jgi:hypothetical protein